MFAIYVLQYIPLYIANILHIYDIYDMYMITWFTYMMYITWLIPLNSLSQLVLNFCIRNANLYIFVHM